MISANKKYLGMALAILFAAPGLSAAGFVVAPGGDDKGPGTPQKPFATMARARDAVRSLKGGSAPKESIRVELRQGTYFLEETLTFGPTDSGAQDFPVVYTSYPGETAVVSGGRPLSGLTEEKGPDGLRRWKTTLPRVAQGTWYFRQLFATPTGAPVYTRRYRPHLGMKRVAGLTYSPRRQAAAHRAAQIDFVFHPGDFQQWSNPTDIEVVVLHVWASSRLLVSNIDTERNTVTFTGMPTFAVDQGGLNPYFIENVKEALSQPGEWYLDRKTGGFTYLPLAAETLENTRLVAPALPRILLAQADYSKGETVRDLVFSNLVFSHSEMELPPQGYGGSQGAPDLTGAIGLKGADRFSFVGCTIAHVGSYGIEIGLGCHGNKIVGCRLTDLAGGGVKVGDPGLKANAVDPEVPADNTVANCVIENGGLLYLSANAVWGGIGRNLQIRHNEISNFAYAGIAVGWLWHDAPSACKSNVIEGNVISHVCTLLADGASIYMLGRQPGTIIRGNVVRDNPKSQFAKEYWQLGLYLDEGSSEMLVENNLVWKVGTHGFNINGGAQNVIRNNILGPVYGNYGPFIRSYAKKFSKENIFERNISFCDSPNLADADWSKSLFLTRSNIYHHLHGSNFTWFGKDFEAWRAGGQDEGSLVANPLFKDPENGDFSLKPGSHALALGFKPFDPRLAGLEGAYKSLKVALPASEYPVFAMKMPAVDSRPPDFSYDFEEIPLGMIPRGFTANGVSPEAKFEVSEESPLRGRRSLKITDSTKAVKVFYPYLTCLAGKPVVAGKLEFSCAFRQNPVAPLMLDIGFRDYTHRGNPTAEFTTGPQVQFQSDGRVTVGKETLTTVPAGKWATLTVAMDLDAHTAVVSISGEGALKKEKSVALSKEFTAFTWFGFVAGDSVDGSAFIDDLKLVTKP